MYVCMYVYACMYVCMIAGMLAMIIACMIAGMMAIIIAGLRLMALLQDPHRQDHHPRGRAVRRDRQREGQNPGRRGHCARPHSCPGACPAATSCRGVPVAAGPFRAPSGPAGPRGPRKTDPWTRPASLSRVCTARDSARRRSARRQGEAPQGGE